MSLLVIDGIDGRLASYIYSTPRIKSRRGRRSGGCGRWKKRVHRAGESPWGGYPSTSGAGNAGGTAPDELERAKRLLDAGVISDAEFNEVKSKILSRQAF